MDVLIAFLTDLFIIFSTSPIHSSTFFLFGSTNFSNGTRSFSAENIAWIFLASSNSIAWMFSKTFLRCGWTAVGSFVYDRISRSSSLEKFFSLFLKIIIQFLLNDFKILIGFLELIVKTFFSADFAHIQDVFRLSYTCLPSGIDGFEFLCFSWKLLCNILTVKNRLEIHPLT